MFVCPENVLKHEHPLKLPAQKDTLCFDHIFACGCVFLSISSYLHFRAKIVVKVYVYCCYC